MSELMSEPQNQHLTKKNICSMIIMQSDFHRLQEEVMNSGRYSPQFPGLPNIRINRLVMFGVLIVVALLAFEIFNYSTTEFALKDILGGLRFAGIPWATILAIAFCGIDFAGLARMFTPEVGADEPREVWYLFGAWMLAAMMNAMLTWWGVSIAIANHETLGNGIVSRTTLLQIVPIFIAIMVWLIRVLIIGTFSVTGDRLFGHQGKANGQHERFRTQTWQPQTRAARSLQTRSGNNTQTTPYRQARNDTRPMMSHRPIQSTLNTIYHPAPRTPQNDPADPEADVEYESVYPQTDPVYVPVGMSTKLPSGSNQTRMN
jgi:hypothetical protein